MTDNEIIKALECCKVCSSPEYCGRCPYVECTTKKGCVGEMLTDALDLINRQKADIERLRNTINTHQVQGQIAADEVFEILEEVERKIEMLDSSDSEQKLKEGKV